MLLKIHRSYRTVVALCDTELIGKKFEEGTRQLDIKESFYKGDEMNYEEVVRKLKMQAHEDATFNIVGEKSVQAAIEAGLIEDKNVARLKNIPFTLIF